MQSVIKKVLMDVRKSVGDKVRIQSPRKADMLQAPLPEIPLSEIRIQIDTTVKAAINNEQMK